MIKIKSTILVLVLFFSAVSPALALEMPSQSIEASISNLTAKSYLVVEENTGATVLSKDENLQWPPASLTKLVTALVVLDYFPKLDQVVTMTDADEVGGARLAVKSGWMYRQKDLFYSALIASANNATMALARSTGLSSEQFLEKMNEKAKSLGAENSYFLEPAGMNEKNTSTASDYIKIAKAAFENPVVAKAVSLKSYSFRALNGKKVFHNLKNTNKLLSDGQVKVLAGKTGYLEESQRNFVARVKTPSGEKFLVAVFGSKNGRTQFSETKELALYASAQLKELQKNVLGLTIKNN